MSLCRYGFGWGEPSWDGAVAYGIDVGLRAMRRWCKRGFAHDRSQMRLAPPHRHWSSRARAYDDVVGPSPARTALRPGDRDGPHPEEGRDRAPGYGIGGESAGRERS